MKSMFAETEWELMQEYKQREFEKVYGKRKFRDTKRKITNKKVKRKMAKESRRKNRK